jgi:hypothetical protein
MAPRRSHRNDPPRVQAAWANLVEKMTRRSKYRKNTNEYRKFCLFVHSKSLADDTLPAPLFINRQSVDEYFRKVVVSRAGNNNTITRIVNALQYYYDNVERKLLGAPPPLTLKNAVVTEALKTQQEDWRLGKLDLGSKRGSDPHNNLKDRMPMSDKVTIINHIHKNRMDWGSLGTSFTWGNNAGVRGASSRALVYSDINMCWGFGPEDTGEHARVLMLVLRKGGGIHKDNFITDKQVGVWRHKHYLMCAAFNLSMHVINELRQNTTINFYHEEKDERAPWWDTPLVDFASGDAESKAMTDVLKKTGVSSCKVTHHRTQAVQHGGAEGLAPWQISTFTKHMTEKIHAAYFPECNEEAMHVMSGYKKDEPYGAYYRKCKLQHTVDQYVRLLLPKYPEYLRQQKSAMGDKSTCCTKFLYDIIPFMVEIVVTSGIYLTRDFPSHPMSQYLRVSLVFRLSQYTSLLTLCFLLVCIVRPESNCWLFHVGYVPTYRGRRARENA